MNVGNRVNSVDQGLTDEVVKLYMRGRRVTGWTVNTILLALVAGVIGAVWALLSHYALPVTELQSIDVPESLLKRFSDSTVVLRLGQDSSLPFTSVADQLSGAFSGLQGPVAFSFSILGLAVCGGLMVFGVDLSGLFALGVRVGLGISLMIASANILSSMSESSSAYEKQVPAVSDRAEFAKAVKEKNAQIILSKLSTLSPRENNSASDYVRAQVGILKGRDESPSLYQRVSNAIEANPGFTPNEQVAYLIDQVAFGEAKTDIARQYRDESLASAAHRSWVAKIAFGFAGLFVLVAIGFGWVARILIKRVHRLDSDLANKVLDREKKKPKTAAV